MYTAIRKSLNKENDKGFTLIELLVVIIIIGILAAIAIPIFLSQRKKAFEASEKSDARSIATQMETFYTDAQVYPSSGDLAWDAASGRVTFGTVVDADGPDNIAGNADDGTTSLSDPNAEYVVLSPNNVASVYTKGGTGGFCVEVASTSTDKTAVYNSTAGGLTGMFPDADTDCVTAGFTAILSTPEP